jgi:hypothetical protein
LSCPVHGLEIDPKTLELIDKDKDERIRVPEVLDAVRWLTSLIKNPDELVKEIKVFLCHLLTIALRKEKYYLHPPSKFYRIWESLMIMKLRLRNHRTQLEFFANTKFNGDGVITEDSTDDEAIKKTY